jgi:hypothetical protein
LGGTLAGTADAIEGSVELVIEAVAPRSGRAMIRWKEILDSLMMNADTNDSNAFEASVLLSGCSVRAHETSSRIRTNDSTTQV